MVTENEEKKHCSNCKSKEVKLNGKTKQGKQRYQCLSCKKTYTWKQNKCIEERRYNWFIQWILEGLTVKQISRINKVSNSTVNRVINYWLKKQPPKLKDLDEIKYIILDGTYINHRTGLYAVMDSIEKKIIYGEYGINETGKHLKTFYSRLQKEGLNPLSATIDGSLQQLKYLKKAWDNLIIQRCLVHIQRQGLSWLRQKPKRIESMELRDLLLKVLYIKTKEQSENFVKGFKLWEDRFGLSLISSTNRGKVFSDLLRTRSMLINALPNMFNYLDNPEISRTTNALEGYFGRLKEKYRVHRGLSPAKRKNYFRWYFCLKPI
jgi:transposase-like protein